jgi:DNA-binding helix-hairpin-helix protein with protein kinase domain
MATLEVSDSPYVLSLSVRRAVVHSHLRPDGKILPGDRRGAISRGQIAYEELQMVCSAGTCDPRTRICCPAFQAESGTKSV